MSEYDIASRITLMDMMTPTLTTIVSGLESVMDNMEMINASSKGMVDTAALRSGREAVENLKTTLASVETETEKNRQAQEQHNNSIRNAQGPADNLLGKIKTIAATYISMQGIKMAVGLSDELTLTTARLNQINDGLQTTEELNQMIYNSAMRSRGAYSQTADIVSKLGLQAGHAFSNNQEIIAFTEQLQKRFKIAGTDAQGIESVMYNLTQALSTGVLRGQDLNSVLANAPAIAQDTAKYMGYTVDQVKELAEEGELTARNVIEAMLATAEETNEAFGNIPMTFSDMWIGAINHIQHALQPVLERMNEIINTESFQQGASAIVEVVTWMANILVEVLASVIEIAAFVSENWSTIEPIVWGIVAALGAWFVATHVQAAATAALDLANKILNSTLLANPIYLIIAAIVAIIVVIYRWVQSVGGIQIAWLTFKMHFWGVVNSVQIWFANMILSITKGLFTMQSGVARAVTAVKNWFTDMKVNVIKLAQDMVNGVISAINHLINMVNRIPGVAIDAIEGVSWAAQAEVNAEATKQAREQELALMEAGHNDQLKEMQDKIVQMEFEATSNRLDRENEIRALKAEQAQNQAANTPSNIFDASQYEDMISTGQGLGSTGALGNIADTAANTGKMAKDTSKISESLDRTNEELGYLKDLATARAIDRFSVDKIDIRMENAFGDVNSDVDLDGYMGKLLDNLEERVEYGIGGAINV